MTQWAFLDHVLEPRVRRLSRAGETLHLSPKAMDLLVCLVERRDRFVSKEELQQLLWSDVTVGRASLPGLVKELRRALGDDSHAPRIIRTLHGRGYQFLPEVHIANDEFGEPEEAASAPQSATMAQKGIPLGAAFEAELARIDGLSPQPYSLAEVKTRLTRLARLYSPLLAATLLAALLVSTFLRW